MDGREISLLCFALRLGPKAVPSTRRGRAAPSILLNEWARTLQGLNFRKRRAPGVQKRARLAAVARHLGGVKKRGCVPRLPKLKVKCLSIMVGARKVDFGLVGHQRFLQKGGSRQRACAPYYVLHLYLRQNCRAITCHASLAQLRWRPSSCCPPCPSGSPNVVLVAPGCPPVVGAVLGVLRLWQSPALGCSFASHGWHLWCSCPLPCLQSPGPLVECPPPLQTSPRLARLRLGSGLALEVFPLFQVWCW